MRKGDKRLILNDIRDYIDARLTLGRVGRVHGFGSRPDTSNTVTTPLSDPTAINAPWNAVLPPVPMPGGSLQRRTCSPVDVTYPSHLSLHTVRRHYLSGMHYMNKVTDVR